VLIIEIDRYGFFEANTDISAINGYIGRCRYFQNF